MEDHLAEFLTSHLVVELIALGYPKDSLPEDKDVVEAILNEGVEKYRAIHK